MNNPTIKRLETHPIALILPPMSDVDREYLRQGMRENGFDESHAIVLYEGMILDGRNRYEMAIELEIPFTTKDYTGYNPIDFVIQENIRRRHLNASQAACCGAELAEMWKMSKDEKARKGGLTGGVGRKVGANLHQPDASERAASVVGVSERSVNTAAALKRDDPEAFEQVRAGETTLNAAKTEADRKKAAAERATELFNKAIGIIERDGGQDLAEAAKKNLTNREITTLSGIDAGEMQRITPFIQSGWSLKRALGYQSTILTPCHKIEDGLDRALAQGGVHTMDAELYGTQFRAVFTAITDREPLTANAGGSGSAPPAAALPVDKKTSLQLAMHFYAELTKEERQLFRNAQAEMDGGT